MWKNYSAKYVRQNRGFGVPIMAAALIASVFLSLLCSLYYNFWAYEIGRIVLEEGDWQGRVTGAEKEDLAVIGNFANVERAVFRENVSDGQDAADIYFQHMRDIYRDMPLIVEKLGLEADAASYHELLLSRYMIHDPQDKEPPLLLAFYLLILFVASSALILIIHNAFAVSMHARVRQFGIFSSIGATPAQILACLMREAASLCALPVLTGCFLGIALSAGVTRLSNLMAAGTWGRHEAVFQYHVLVFAVTIGASAVTVFISAWLPARTLSKMTPLLAIRGAGELQLSRKKESRILTRFFGIEGKLAGNALRAQRKALRASSLSFTLSFLGFTLMLCFFTLSGISTKHTYFERYQNAWDIMVTLKGAKVEDFEGAGQMRRLAGVSSGVAYQKANAKCIVPKADISEELCALGGLEAVDGSQAGAAGDPFYTARAPIIIMDDEGFAEYCARIGVTPRFDGTIVLNRIWDSINSNFRYPDYIPFLKEEGKTVTLQNEETPKLSAKVPVLAYTAKEPVLREEYDDYALTQFISASLWRQISGQIGNAQEDMYIRAISSGEATLDALNLLEKEILQAVGQGYDAESENRLRQKESDGEMRRGMMMILGAFCVLLALIGIANIFSNTLGFLWQRKREFARYASVGMTPKGMWKMFAIEALVTLGRPVLVTVPLTAIFLGFMITASHLDPMEFWEAAPALPILMFVLAIFGFVGLAYYLGGSKITRRGLAQALRDDSLM